tara:strand:- start:2490 stop:2945 length:456 start_codon:yes stop_codon:yes gene_type:complete
MSDTKLENALRVLLARGGWDMVATGTTAARPELTTNTTPYIEPILSPSTIEKEENETCDVWEGLVDKEGRGYLLVDGTRLNAARLAWAYANDDDLRPGHEVRQTCDNLRCVRVSHLEECDDGVSRLRRQKNEKRRKREAEGEGEDKLRRRG